MSSEASRARLHVGYNLILFTPTHCLPTILEHFLTYLDSLGL
jgi:hypothetical protein